MEKWESPYKNQMGKIREAIQQRDLADRDRCIALRFQEKIQGLEQQVEAWKTTAWGWEAKYKELFAKQPPEKALLAELRQLRARVEVLECTHVIPPTYKVSHYDVGVEKDFDLAYDDILQRLSEETSRAQ